MSTKFNDATFWNICLDFEKSHGSFLFDKNTNKNILDFFGMYSSLPLGYNHPVFDESFYKQLKYLASVKTTNCEFDSDVRQNFCQHFHDLAGVGLFDKYHFTCTGSLAVESACKLAMYHTKKQRMIAIDNSFHGTAGYGNFATSHFGIVAERLSGFPDFDWAKVSTIEELKVELSRGDIAGVLVEPIQSTFGDNHLPKDFLQDVSKVSKEFDVPVIYDEVQTGFGTTGKVWCFEHFDIKPDIVAFGKKTQVSGVMTSEKYSSGLDHRLCVTFDGDLVDMLRGTYIMKAYRRGNLLENAKDMGEILIGELRSIDGVENARGKGLMIAFDVESNEFRGKLLQRLKDNGAICNMAGERTLRVRPNLAVDRNEINTFLKILNISMQQTKGNMK